MSDLRKTYDILDVLAGCSGKIPNIGDVEFAVAVRPDSCGSWHPFDAGEIYLLDRGANVYGQELGPQQRSPYKWDVQVETFTELAAAKERSEQVKARRAAMDADSDIWMTSASIKAKP